MKDGIFDLPRYLSVLPLFNDMTGTALQRIAAGSQVRRFSRAEMVFQVGQPCAGFCVPVCGQVKLFALSAAGQEKVIDLAGPGVSFGEALIFTGGEYNFNAQTITETLLLTIDRQTVLSEAAQDSSLALRMLAGISGRLHDLMQDVQAYALHSGLQRVIDYLLTDARRPGRAAATVSLPASKAIIASRLSLTPEYFSRTLHDLEAAGLIRIDKRTIRIFDSARLASCQEERVRAARQPAYRAKARMQRGKSIRGDRVEALRPPQAKVLQTEMLAT